jgi:hypothetical protein
MRRTQKTQTTTQPMHVRMSETKTGVRTKPRDTHTTSPTGTCVGVEDGTSPTGTCVGDRTTSIGTYVGDQYGRSATYVYKKYSCFDCDHPHVRYRYSPKTAGHTCARCKNKSRQSVRCTEIRAEDAVSGFILITRIPLCVPCQHRADCHEFDTQLSSSAATMTVSEAMAKTTEPVVSEATASSAAMVMTDKPVVSEAITPLQYAPSYTTPSSLLLSSSSSSLRSFHRAARHH